MLQLLKPMCPRAHAPHLLSLHTLGPRVPQLPNPHAATAEARTPRARAPQQEACTQRRAAPVHRN